MRTAILCSLAVAFLSACATRGDEPELRFSVEDGAIRNDFFRDGPVAAHLILKSASAPRLVVAFPAGNSGVGAWFAPAGETVRWQAPQGVAAKKQKLDDGAVRYGIEFDTAVSVAELALTKAVLSNVRVLRDYNKLQRSPEAVDVAPRIEGSKAIWDRRRIDGAAGYYLSIEALNGSIENRSQAPSPVFVASGGAPLRFHVVALSGDPPLKGIPQAEILTETAGSDARLRNVLTFLSYDEKLLAGSWQYNTYFGRDTLMTLALLGDSLRPAAVEAGLGSVIDRLSDRGEVAHEEDISEFALLRRRKDGAPESDEPILDYKMIDDDYMLAPVLASYLIEREDGAARAQAFLSRRSPAGISYRDLVFRNLEFVADEARPYAQRPHWSKLVRLKANIPVGEWRDSRNGLGGGVYPYNVNAALVPAALDAASRLAASGLLGDGEELKAFAEEAHALAAIWAEMAPAHFRVSIARKEAEKKIAKAAAKMHLKKNASAAADVLNGISFPALALDENGAPIRVMNSDPGFAMLFGAPDMRDLEAAANLILRPFPAGLMTPAGMVVANAVFAPDEEQEKFGKDRYHGAVIWSWQQAMMIDGLKRQLNRPDLKPGVREKLSAALDVLQSAVSAGEGHQAAELWTWAVEDGSIRRAPYGDSAGDENESNAAQLWSTAHLASKAKQELP